MKKPTHPRYFPKEIESKWAEKWRADGLNDFVHNPSRQKYYVLVELPYPSGNLHIGHWFTFASADILARFKRMTGENVFFPMGFDAIGLPAENAAIKHGLHPKDWTYKNIETMTAQFQQMGTMMDWNRVTITADPSYMKANQWIFLKMYEKGIAYRSKTLSNWCPKDQTVLANEHVENGKCWRCGEEVVQKEVEQWFLKITDYANELLWKNPDDKQSNGVEWPKSVMIGQNEWIGKKEGMKITHEVVGMDLKFQTFTAYPAWSWADTFIVIAPEHPLVKELVKGTEHEKPVMKFVREMGKQTEMQRKETTEKHGIFTGRYAKDPFGGPDMPIWLANFALLNFGTGIIRCSAHDPRDVEFAAKYGIPTKQVVDGIDDVPAHAHDNKGILKDSGPFTGQEVSEILEEVKVWIESQGIGVRYVNYHLHDWSVSRQRYWGTPVPIINCPKCGMVPVPEKDLPVELPYDVDYTPKGKPPLASNDAWYHTSCPKCDGEATRDPETLDTFFDSSWYYYRYTDPESNALPFDREKVKQLMPVDIYFGGAEHTLGHTLYARFFTKFFKDLGLIDFDEFAKKRIQHGIVLGPDGNKMSKSKGNVINPDDVVKDYGADAVRLYLAFMMPYEATGPWSTTAMSGMFRFLKRVWDLQGKIAKVPQVPNVPKALKGKSASGTSGTFDTFGTLSKRDLFMMHKTIKKVSEDVEAIKMNTAVAAVMEWLNFVSAKETVAKEEYKTMLLLLAPFAPYITEELWQKMTTDYGLQTTAVDGGQWTVDESIHRQPFPKFDPKYLVEDTVTIVVQVNGKMRHSMSLSREKSTDQKAIEVLAKGDNRVAGWLAGKEIKKIIVVPGKLINFVVV